MPDVIEKKPSPEIFVLFDNPFALSSRLCAPSRDSRTMAR